jgi:orotidine-5'-phosphate decarboxylase
MSDLTTADDRLIVALDMPDALSGMAMAEKIGDAVSFYKIGLGMLTGGGLALANELADEHGKRIFLDMKLFDIGATVETAVRGLSRFGHDFLTVHGDPHVVRAAACVGGVCTLCVVCAAHVARRRMRRMRRVR